MSSNTISSFMSAAGSNAEAHDMSKSPTSLMMLPPEIRIMIYKAFLDDTDAFGTLRCLFSGNTKHPAKEILSLLMTSPRVRKEVLPLSLPEVRLCVGGQRSHKNWDAGYIQDSANNHLPVDIIWAPVPPYREYFEFRPCFLQSRKMTAWNGNLLLKSFNILTMTILLYGPFTLSVAVCFDGQRGVEVSLLSNLISERLSCNYIAVKDLNDAAIVKLKAKTLRRLRTFKSFKVKLIEGIASDLRRVGWHTYPKVRETNNSYELDRTWHISVPGTSAQEEADFRKAEDETIGS